MDKQEFSQHRVELFNERTRVSDSAQKEYAINSASAFDNFNRVGQIKCICDHCGKPTTIGRMAAWAVYFTKHVDGVLSWIAGNTAQREDVRGRITDIVNYADLLDGMIVEDRERAEERDA